MTKYIKAAACADIISEKFNIPLDDLVDVFADIPAADVEEVKDVKTAKGKVIKEYKEKVIEVLLGKSIFPVLVKNALNEAEKEMVE